jgi:hypothetical protein
MNKSNKNCILPRLKIALQINYYTMKFFRILLILFVLPAFSQQGGMWIPSLLKGMNETEMKSLGMKLSADEVCSF